ncbi:hypothetical protein ACOMHN_047134 [Nucella lapillus]
MSVSTHQSNLYAYQLLSGVTELSQYTRLKEAKDDITVPEMMAYVALQIAMGLCCKPEIEDYWRTYWLSKLPFGTVMSRNRYELITRFLHFNDNSQLVPRGQEGYDPLFKVRRLLDIVDPLYSQV